MTGFDYRTAFSRNIGWVTEYEQQSLKSKKVAIGGLGGVGGSHLVTLARLGIGNFSIADMDTFDWPNMNRQAGAFASTIGLSKIDVMADQIRGINPEVNLSLFTNGVTEENLDQFLEGADLYMDSLDIFCIEIREKVFARCRKLGIPAITAAPMGMGTAILVFDPHGMSFEEYFGLSGLEFEDKILKFIIGVSPKMMQRHYLVHKGTLNITSHKAPSTPMGIDLAAGVACTNALKVLLKRGDVRCAPRGLHFDAYLNKTSKTWRPFGAKNPLQKLMFHFIKRLLALQNKK